VGFIPQDALVAAPGHLGLAAIRGRAEMAGGWSKLWSLPSEGTTLEIWLPHDEADPTPSPLEDDRTEIADVLPLSGRIASARAAAARTDDRAMGSHGTQRR
jgi:hypothetical protein